MYSQPVKGYTLCTGCGFHRRSDENQTAAINRNHKYTFLGERRQTRAQMQSKKKKDMRARWVSILTKSFSTPLSWMTVAEVAFFPDRKTSLFFSREKTREIGQCTKSLKLVFFLSYPRHKRLKNNPLSTRIRLWVFSVDVMITKLEAGSLTLVLAWAYVRIQRPLTHILHVNQTLTALEMKEMW